MARYCAVIMSIVGIAVSLQLGVALSLPAAVTCNPTNCTAVETICSQDAECNKLLETFYRTCRKALYHGHKKHCHQKCANAIDRLIEHELGTGINTCHCGEDEVCKKTRQYLKKACRLKHGERNCLSNCNPLSCRTTFSGSHHPNPKSHCKTAIDRCLLDSCCRKAYREFYYGEECKYILGYSGIGPEPTCTDACVAKFDQLAKSPHADGLFECDCNDLGTLCTSRYDRYDTHCIERRFKSPSKDVEKRQAPDEVITPLPSPIDCRTVLVNCLSHPQCSAAFIDLYFGECRSVLRYMDDGPPPRCSPVCARKIAYLKTIPQASQLLTCDCSALGTICSKIVENINEYCQGDLNCPGQTRNCTQGMLECSNDEACGPVLQRFLFGTECKNVLTFSGDQDATKPVCSNECIETERELRKQPKARNLLYCDCSSDNPTICSRPRDNFNQFCNECPDTYSSESCKARTPDTNDCIAALGTCVGNDTCTTAYHAFFGGSACHSVLSYTNGTEPNCSDECVALERTLRQHPAARALTTDCDCGGLDACTRSRANFERFCVSDCAVAMATCQSDDDCSTIMNKFLKGPECSNVLYAEKGTHPTCSADCLAVHQELIAHPMASKLLTCTCGTLGRLCCAPRHNFFQFCDVPASTPRRIDNSCLAKPTATSLAKPTATRPTALCQDVMKVCSDDPQCATLFHNFQAKRCRHILFHIGKERPVCTISCLVAHKQLLSHPKARDLLSCDCGDKTSVCAIGRGNFFKYCPVPENPDFPTDNTSCEIKLHECLDRIECRRILEAPPGETECDNDTVISEPACDIIVKKKAKLDHACRDKVCGTCLGQQLTFVTHPDGINLQSCPCAMHSCRVLKSTIIHTCVSPPVVEEDD